MDQKTRDEKTGPNLKKIKINKEMDISNYTI